MDDRINLEDVRDWKLHPVTKWFFSIIADMKESNTNAMRGFLRKNALQEAALENAGYTELERVEEIPQDMIDFINGEKEHEGKTA